MTSHGESDINERDENQTKKNLGENSQPCILDLLAMNRWFET